MQRVHLFEFEDQPWFSPTLRKGITDVLAFLGNASEAPYLEFVHRLRLAMEEMGERRLLDLCSGGSGPLRMLLRMLEERERYPVHATLTDLYPDLETFEHLKAGSGGRIEYVAEPVDATSVPAHLQGFRLVCNGFHHLKPHQARQVLADAVADGRGIAVLELLERSVPNLLFMALGSVLSLVVMPFLRPWCWSRMLFSYLLPIIPLVGTWDGIVSCLRCYSEPELKELTVGLGGPRYRWEILRHRVGPMAITMLIGRPGSSRHDG